MALAAVRKGPVYALGPLAHNESLLARLEAQGVKFVETLSEVPDDATVLIRSHGVRPEVFQQASARGIQVINATCIFVQKLQQLVARLIDEGKQVVIVGDASHPEVKGVLGWGRDLPTVIPDVTHLESMQSLNPEQAVAVVAQTTQRESILTEIGEKLKLKVPVVEIYNTICKATALRQEAAQSLAREVDVMVVVGGKNSANTGKLADVCRSAGVKTITATDAHDLDMSQLHGVRTVGITAGASTPDWTIKEVIGKMENEKDMELQEEQTAAEEVSLNQDVKDFSVGDVVKGTVVQVSADEVLVDIGYKSEGVLPRQEIIVGADQELASVLQVGQEVEAEVKEVDDQEGKIVLSTRMITKKQKWVVLESAFQEGKIINGIVKETVTAGLVVDLGGGYEGFMPGSLVDVRYIPDFSEFLGQEISFKIIEIRREKEKLILSRKQVLEEKVSVTKEKILSELKAGQVIKGTVKRLTNFGAFVDVGGIDGLVHISEISWQRIENPSEVLTVGDEVDVKVIEVIPERERIGLSLRQAQADPWTEAAKKLKAGDMVEGKVTRTVDFGAFVELLPGVEGLVHISQLANFHVKRASEVVQNGQMVQVKILDINPEGKRVSLSMRETNTTPNPNPSSSSSSNPRPRRESSREVKQYQTAEPVAGLTLGDLFGNLFEIGRASCRERV